MKRKNMVDFHHFFSADEQKHLTAKHNPLDIKALQHLKATDDIPVTAALAYNKQNGTLSCIWVDTNIVIFIVICPVNGP